MKSPYDVIIKPVVTEASMDMLADKKYTFKDFWSLVESKQKEKPHLSKEFPWYEQIDGYDFANNEFS